MSHVSFCKSVRFSSPNWLHSNTEILLKRKLLMPRFYSTFFFAMPKSIFCQTCQLLVHCFLTIFVGIILKFGTSILGISESIVLSTRRMCTHLKAHCLQHVALAGSHACLMLSRWSSTVIFSKLLRIAFVIHFQKYSIISNLS